MRYGCSRCASTGAHRYTCVSASRRGSMLRVRAVTLEEASRLETYLPTQYPQAFEDPWFSTSNADAWRESRASGPPGPRPEASLGLIWRVPRPWHLRGLRSGSPSPGRSSLPSLRGRRVGRSPASRLRDRAPSRVCRRAQPHPTPHASVGRGLCRRPRSRRRLSSRGGACRADRWFRRPVPDRRRSRPACLGATVVTEAPPEIVRPTFPARLLMLPVRAWRLLSVHLPPRCRFHPSCSQYALDALSLHGAGRGTWLAVRRVARCHPWHDGGFDPVPEPNVRSAHTLPQT